MNFILIGKGNWGKKLYNNLLKIGKVKGVLTSKSDIKNFDLNNIDWAIVSSPNKFHFKYVKYFLEKKINVFCEKPLTESIFLTKKLFRIAKINKTKLYISDIEIFKKKKITIRSENDINRGKKCNYSFAKTLYALAYHDFYLLNKYISNKKRKIEILKKNKNCYQFRINTNKSVFNFNYNLNKYCRHKINNISFDSKKNYISIMFKKVFSKKVNFNKNHKRALDTSILIDKILKI